MTNSNQHGVAATLGHLQSNGGLRGHSVGDVFPYVPFYRGTFDNLELWLRCPDGEDVGPFDNIEQMHAFIKLDQSMRAVCTQGVEGLDPFTLASLTNYNLGA